MDKKTQNSDTGDIKKQKPYFDKNKLFGVWIPSSLYEWFQQYLEKYSTEKCLQIDSESFCFCCRSLRRKEGL